MEVYTRESLKGKKVGELRTICAALGLPKCEGLKGSTLVARIVAASGGAAPKKTTPKKKPKKATPKKKPKKATPVTVISSPHGPAIVITQDINKMTIAKLKALMTSEGIALPLGKGKAGPLKKDLIKAIIDHRAIGSGGASMEIPLPAKPVAKPKKMTLTQMRKKCNELGIERCLKKGYINMKDLEKLIAAHEAGGPALLPAIAPAIAPPSVNYSARAVGYLRAQCKKRGIDASKCKGNKLALVAVLEEYDRLQAGGSPPHISPPYVSPHISPPPPPYVSPHISPPPYVSPAHVSPHISPAEFAYMCGDKENKCGEKACDVYTGACLSRTKKDKNLTKRAADDRRKKYGDDYYFDEKHGLVGRKVDVLKHIDHWGVSTSPHVSPAVVKPPSPAPYIKPPSPVKPKPKKSKCTDKENPLLCGDGEVCIARTGACHKDSDAVRKGKSMLTVEGRVIIGTNATIKKLQGILGGKIAPATKAALPPPPPHVSPPHVSPPRPTTPKTQKGLESRIAALLAEGDDDGEEIRKLQTKLDELKKKKKKASPKPPAPKPPKPATPPPSASHKLETAKKDIALTFAQCLASLS